MTEPLLDERFDCADLSPALTWYCQPSTWRIESGRLMIEPDAKTDYWQKTHYGFSVDNGPFLHTQVDGDFAITTRVHLYPHHQYDQAGLMVRIDAEHWIKTSVEHEVGEPSKLGAVVTAGGYSDWSTQDVPDGVSEVSFRISRTGDDYIVESMLHAGVVAGMLRAAGSRSEWPTCTTSITFRYSAVSMPAARLIRGSWPSTSI